MPQRTALLFSAALLASTSCTSQGSDAGGTDKADDLDGEAGICFSQQLDAIPPSGSGFVDGPCLIFENPEFEAAELSVRDGGGNLVVTPRFTHLIRVEKAVDPIKREQLVATLTYFHGAEVDEFADPPKAFADMTNDELETAGENAFFRYTFDNDTGEAYDHVNIGMGDNPFELVFRHGTLEPVAATEDGSLTACELTAGPAPEPATSCCKMCGENSQACGDSCISLDKVCRVGKGCACDAPATSCPDDENTGALLLCAQESCNFGGSFRNCLQEDCHMEMGLATDACVACVVGHGPGSGADIGAACGGTPLP